MGLGAMISFRGLKAMVAKKMIGARQNSAHSVSTAVRSTENLALSDISPSPI